MKTVDYLEMLVLSKMIELNYEKATLDNDVLYIEAGGKKYDMDKMKQRLSDLVDKYLEKYVINDVPKGN